MKKSLIMLLALSSGAFAAVDADTLNYNLKEAIKASGYTKGTSYKLTFTITGVGADYTGNIFKAADGGYLYTQDSRFIGLSTGDSLETVTATPVYNESGDLLKYEYNVTDIDGGVMSDTYTPTGEKEFGSTAGWFRDNLTCDYVVHDDTGYIDGVGFKYQYTVRSFNGTDKNLSTLSGTYPGAYVDIGVMNVRPTLDSMDLNEVEFLFGASEVTLEIDGESYNLAAAPAVPEPTTATLSLLALAGLAARRRRK